MSAINSFDPVVGKYLKILILGSIPGVRSLEVAQYYAHPQNQFWRIMGALLHVDMPPIYQQRLEVLKAHGIGLWDVIEGCEREGSLDSNIKAAKVNAINELIESHPELEVIALNGKTAEKYFNQAVKAGMIDLGNRLAIGMPSTSPAHTMVFEKKLEAWKKLYMK